MKAIIFDLDGVIVSTDSLHYQSWKYVADLNDLYFDEVLNHQLRGISRLESLEVILSHNKRQIDLNEKEVLMALKNNYYVTLLENLSPKDIKEGILQLLDICMLKDIRVAIGSSSKNAVRILKQLNILDRFDTIVDGNDIVLSKPNPEVFLKACSRLGFTQTECIVIEDAHAGILAAKNAGMLAFAVGDALTSPLKDGSLEDVFYILSGLKNVGV